ncbi:hypothetical protein AAGR22_14335 [Erwinia sp. HDF1-3R]|uniref:hypothetical protein n=1 Tax=Erwinia sp. HDF1-3R TaxID=3141543 RepID=UPI0031F541F3
MIAWSGVGFFVALLISVAYLLCKWLFDIYYYEGYFVEHLWATGATLLLAALFCGAFVWVLRQERWLDAIAKATKSQPMMAPEKTHNFFFIPVLYWPIILFLLGSGICLWDLTR